MKTLSATAILRLFLPLIVLLGGSAWADQRDPRLDDLFGKLKNVQSISDAKGVEFVIWNIWGQSGDNAIDLLMRDGMESMGRRDYKRALRSFDQIVTIAPEFAEGWNKRATLYYLMGEFERSLDDIDKTLDLEPRHFGALAGRGLIYVELEDDALALEAFEDALVINPFLPAARQNAEVLRKRIKDRAI